MRHALLAKACGDRRAFVTPILLSAERFALRSAPRPWNQRASAPALWPTCVLAEKSKQQARRGRRVCVCSYGALKKVAKRSMKARSTH